MVGPLISAWRASHVFSQLLAVTRERGKDKYTCSSWVSTATKPWLFNKEYSNYSTHFNLKFSSWESRVHWLQQPGSSGTTARLQLLFTCHWYHHSIQVTASQTLWNIYLYTIPLKREFSTSPDTIPTWIHKLLGTGQNWPASDKY